LSFHATTITAAPDAAGQKAGWREEQAVPLAALTIFTGSAPARLFAARFCVPDPPAPRCADSNRELAPRLSSTQCRCRLPLHAVSEGRLILPDAGRLVSPPLTARIQPQSSLSVVRLSFFNVSRTSRREKPRVTAQIQSTSLSSRVRRSAGGRHSSSAATQHTQRS
jgi:hypothetical protein